MFPSISCFFQHGKQNSPKDVDTRTCVRYCSLMDTLTSLEQAIDALLRPTVVFPDVQAIDESVAILSTAISRLEGLRIRLLRERGGVDRSVLSAGLGLSRGEAAQVEKAVDRLAALPALQAAVESGQVSMSKVRMVAETVTQHRAEAAVRDEAALTALALSLSPVQLGRELERWGRTVDDEAGLATGEVLRAQRSLDTRKKYTGMTELIGQLDPESADIVNTALDARTRADWQHEPAPEHNLRTATQRRVDALVGICTDALNAVGTGDANPTGSPKARPHVSVVIDLATLRDATGTAVTERGTFITAEAARRMCCDAGISRIITDSVSQIVDVGREERTFSHALRKVLVMRDGGCRMSGCNAPPSWTQGHHIKHWINGGLTNHANGCLLCSRHHHACHEGGWTITGDPNGELVFTSPTGQRLSSWPSGISVRIAIAS